MARISAYWLLGGLEAWVTGYRVEHLKLGLQMAIALCLSLLPVLIQSMYLSLDRGSSALYTAITVAVVLEPSTGDSWRKLILRLLGAGVGGGLSLLVLYIAVGEDPYQYTADEFSSIVGPWAVPFTALWGFVLMTNHQRYWRHRAFWSAALLTLPVTLVPALRTEPKNFYTGTAYRMLNVVNGIVLAAFVSYIVFPVRAGTLLEKKMASTLTKIGDLAVWMVGQVCVLPQAGGGGAMPGASGTDEQHMYTDDGLHAKLAPLMDTAAELTSDLAHMGKLLEAASREYYIVHKPRIFPRQRYKMLLDSCHVVLGILLSLLYAQEGAQVSLQVCQRHIGDLSEVGVRLSAAFTALSGLIRKPKGPKGAKPWTRLLCCTAKKRAKRRHGSTQQQEQQAGAAAAAATEPPGAANGAGSADAAAAALDKEQQRRAADSAALGAAADGEAALAGPAPSVEDPFAGLSTAPSGLGVSSLQPVVGLTDSELFSAQAIARHLSMVAERRSSSRHGRSASHRDGGGGGGLDGGLDDSGTDASESQLEVGSGELMAGASADKRREWVLGKLRGLVDAVRKVQASAAAERDAGTNQDGLTAFMLVVHACDSLTRQCGACFTALDAARGAQLHSYWRDTAASAAASGLLPGPLALAGTHAGLKTSRAR